MLFPVVCLPAEAQQTLRLYDGAAPGSQAWIVPESVRVSANGGKTYSNVRDPDLTVYLPEAARANGASVILLPGGGLRALGVGAENDDMTRRFLSEGMAVFVLKYRILQVPPAAPGAVPARNTPGPSLPKLIIRNANANPDPDNAALTEVLEFAIDDARQALRVIRKNAVTWHIDPHRIGMVGSSAGGGVAMGAVLNKGSEEGPAFVGLLYGPSLMDVTVPADAPPLFMATEAGHGPVTEGLLALYSAWKASGKSAELHIFDVPNFQMPASLWLDRFVQWVSAQKIGKAFNP